MGKTLFDEAGTRTRCAGAGRRTDLLYIDLHLVHEVTSPQAFDGLRLAGRRVRRPDRTIATVDHNVPTIGRAKAASEDVLSRTQIEALSATTPSSASRCTRSGDAAPGHRARRRPGARAHPARHDGRLRRLATPRPTARSARWRSASARRGRARAGHPDAPAGAAQDDGGHASRASCRPGSRAKDMILADIGQIGVGGGAGLRHRVPGSAIRALSMEGRMTVCNMSIEAGARAGMIAPDQTTYDYLEGPPARAQEPTGTPRSNTGARCPPTRTRGSTARCSSTPPLAPYGHLGHQPGAGRADRRPRSRPRRLRRPGEREAASGRSSTWGSSAGTAIERRRRRHRVHRLVHQRPHRGPARRRRASSTAARSPTACARWSYRLDAVQGAGRGRGPRRRLHRRPAPSGATPAARCASA